MTAITNIFKHKLMLIASATALLLVLVAGQIIYGTAFAAGSASFALSASPSSTTIGKSVTVTINVSGTSVAGAQANLAYDAGILQYVSSANSSNYSLCAQNTGGGGSVEIGCATTSPHSGTTQFATVTFKTLATGTATVQITSGSDIENQSSTSIWNGVDSSTSVTATNPVVSKPPTTPSKPTAPSKPSTPSKATNPLMSAPQASSEKSTAPSKPSTTNKAPAAPKSTTPAAASTTGSLQIVVTGQNGKPIDGAAVALSGVEPTATNPSGSVSLSDLKPGQYQLVISAPGYQTSTQSITVRQGDNPRYNVTLHTAATGAASIWPTLLKWLIVAIGLAIIATTTVLLLRRRHHTKPTYGDPVTTPTYSTYQQYDFGSSSDLSVTSPVAAASTVTTEATAVPIDPYVTTTPAASPVGELASAAAMAPSPQVAKPTAITSDPTTAGPTPAVEITPPVDTVEAPISPAPLTPDVTSTPPVSGEPPSSNIPPLS